MRADVERARRRRWADVAVIVAGLYAFAFAIWFPPVAEADRMGETVRDQGAWWWIHAVAGPLAIASLFVALKAPALARTFVALAGSVLLLGPFLFADPGLFAILTAVLPGLVLLLAAPFVGPMPTPEAEGEHR